MSSIDNRIVRAQFDNAQFEKGVAQTNKSLEGLKKNLNLDGAKKSLDGLSDSGKRFSLAHIGQGVESIASKFSALSVIGVTALATIAHKAIETGAILLKSLTVDPIRDGLREYETNLNSIQTILSNTQWENAKLKDVNKALAELNHYSDQTIYNFAEMARNIGTFTAAGVSLKESTAAIKGIANLAAISGSNSQQASTAMYQLSQALAAGKISLMDWNSVVNAGMGGKVFQDSLMETARVHGVAIDQIVKDEGSFRASISKGWLTSEILTETLSKFTGDLSAAQLKSMSYTEDQIKGIMKMGKTAQDAATKVKTVSQLIGTLQEAAGSGWAQTWQLIFGDFEEARTMFTNVNNVLSAFISTSADARNKVLGDWNDLGGRAALIETIANVFNGLISVIKPIRNAFRDIFPATTGKQLYDITVALQKFSEKLILGSETSEKLRRTFAGIFAVFGIGWEVIKLVVSTLAQLFGVATEGSGSILDVTARFGDFLVRLHEAVKNGEGLKKFFSGLGSVLSVPIRLLKALVAVIYDVFEGFGDVGTEGLAALQRRFEPLGKLGDVLAAGWSRIADIFSAVWEAFEPLAGKMADFFSELSQTIQDSLGEISYDDVLDSINTGLLAGLVVLFKRFLSGGFLNLNVGGGVLDTIKDAFSGITDVMSAMQAQLKANALIKIAGAIALLTASVVALSLIDSAKLTKALTAMTAMFTQLLLSMAIFEKITISSGFVKMPVLTTGLLILAGAITLLTVAVKRLSGLDWNELAKGLTGVTVLIGVMSGSAKILSANSKGMVTAGAGLILLATAINILANAVTKLSGLDWGEMAKGLTGVAALLGALALYTKLSAVNKGGIGQGIGIILLATGIKILADAMSDFGKMSWGEIAKGLVSMAGGLTLMSAALMVVPPSSVLSAAAIFVLASSLGMIADALSKMGNTSWGKLAKGMVNLAGALTIISVALSLLPPSSLLSAAAIFVVAASLGMVADALKDMGEMSWGEIAKGLVALAGSLLIISAAMALMTGALPGAAALLIVAASLKILAPVLLAFGEMSWGELLRGLTMLAGVFLVLGAAGIVLGPLVPVLLGLGAAIALLGVGLLAAGVGVMAFSVGLTTLAAAGAAGTAALVAMVAGLAGLIPTVMKQLALGLVAFAETIAAAGPSFTKAIVVVLISLIDAIDKLTPKIVKTLVRLLVMLLNELEKAVPKLTSAGMRMITGILNGINKNVGKLADAATDVIVTFLNAVSKNQPRVIDAGVKMIISFINGVADAIRSNSSAMGAAGANLGTAVVEGMARGIAGGIGVVTGAAKRVAQSALNAAKSALGIKSPSKEFEKVGKYVVEGFAKGLTGNKDAINAAYENMKNLLKTAISAASQDIKDATAKLKKLRSARHKDTKAIKAAEAALRTARAEHKKASAAYTELTKKLADEKNKLKSLAGQYDKITEKLKNAQQVLDDAKKTRDDYAQSIRDQYGDIPDITKETKLTDFIIGLEKQIAETTEFASAVQRLRDLGLSDQMYKELLARGPAALPFMQELLASGQDGVDFINKLGADLDAAAGSLGKTASEELYQAGVDMAQGLVNGLKKEQEALEKLMDKLADRIVSTLKKKLGIKSPSKVFEKIGQQSDEGLAKGLKKYSDLVEKSAENVGKDAILAMSKSISGIAAAVDRDVNLQPTIRPDLDLTDVRKAAGRIGDILKTQPISLQGAYSQARDAAAGYLSNRAAAAFGTTQPDRVMTGDQYNFIQNNTSPKALSSAEIYRQTNNQISRAKGALAKK